MHPLTLDVSVEHYHVKSKRYCAAETARALGRRLNLVKLERRDVVQATHSYLPNDD